jgi:hypothetical protein
MRTMRKMRTGKMDGTSRKTLPFCDGRHAFLDLNGTLKPSFYLICGVKASANAMSLRSDEVPVRDPLEFSTNAVPRQSLRGPLVLDSCIALTAN